MAKHDLHNPTGSDVIAQKLREEHKQKKAEPAKKRQSLISFEVTSEPAQRHPPQRASKSVHAAHEQHPERTKKSVRTAATAAAGPRWKRIAVIAIIILLVVVLFTNNYRKNTYIEDLKSANEEFAQAYEGQQGKIAELEERLGETGTGS